ncbi:MAG: DUF4350 domain-containing protein [Myxococcales bacterium]|nr:DUF4350 domain-containing protein [Myxococcota bacterium]MDW8281976.1 DUF4350 domain-containing protein [Myxococcales bacterium]
MTRRPRWQVLAPWLLWAAAAGAQPAPTDPSLGSRLARRDYHPAHTGWNGLSRFAELATSMGCPLQTASVLDFAELGGRDVLVVLYPERPLQEHSVVAFLAAGGRLVIGDDFGQGAGVLARLGIRRHQGPLPASVPTFRPGATLPLARAVRSTALGTAATELVTNHPAAFESVLPATYAFLPGLGAIIEGTLGRGRFVALSDPSILINNMLEFEGNLAFAQALLRQFCRPGEDRLVLLTGMASSRGVPPAVLTGAPPPAAEGDVWSRLNLLLAEGNEHIQRTLAHPGPSRGGLDAAALSGLVLGVATLLLLLRYVPLQGAQLDDGFAGADRAGHGSGMALPDLVVRYGRRKVPWGFIYPAILLREEVLRRLSPHLQGLPRYGQTASARVTPDDVARHVAQTAGPQAGRLAAALWRELRILPGWNQAEAARQSTRWLPAWRMDRLYALAVALFAELDRRGPPSEPP